MSHPAFDFAGFSWGFNVWIIDDKFEPFELKLGSLGKFYNGDAYILLRTSSYNTILYKWDLHVWFGANSSQEKRDSAASWVVALNAQMAILDGKMVNHREVQCHESSQFLQYFQPGVIRYLEDSISLSNLWLEGSGVNEVDTNARAEKRLFKLSGCDNIRAEQVPAVPTSLRKEHCFILEVENRIFVLIPEGAKATQRRKIIQGHRLRNDYHNRRATIEIIDEFSSDKDIALFFEALGSGSMDDLVSETSEDSYTRDDPSAVYLYRVKLDDFELVSLSKPYKEKQLNPDEIYVLDTPSAGVFIWTGADVDSSTRKDYFDLVNKYLEAKGYPAWVHVTGVLQGSETANFKQYFYSWDSVKSPVSCGIDFDESDGDDVSEDDKAAKKKMIGKSATARGYMPDLGDGNRTVIRISGNQEDITDQMAGFARLYQSEVYVVTYKYTVNNEDRYVLYWWIGLDASADDKKTGFKLVYQLEDDLGDKATIVKVPQGKEPRHFLNIFKGKLAIIFGDKGSDYKAANSRGTYDDDGVRLFRVEGIESSVDTRAVQVPETAAVLEDDKVFVLETPAAVYVRNGKDCFPSEQEAALDFVKLLVGEEREIIVFVQGEEPDQFWKALGGTSELEDASGWKKGVSRRLITPAILTSVSVSVTGKIKFEDLAPEFEQQDLSDDSVYILDTGEELYLWQGAEISERVKLARTDIVQAFISGDGLDRSMDTVVVIGVKRSREPAGFRKLFPEWDDQMWDNLPSYEDLKNDVRAANSK